MRFLKRFPVSTLFGCVLLTFFLLNGVKFLKILERTVGNEDVPYKTAASDMESQFNEEFSQKFFFIELNGAVNRVLGRRMMNDRYRLKNGYLAEIQEEQNVEENAGKLIAFHQALEKKHTPFLFVSAPFKVSKYEKQQLPEGISDYANENMDKMLQELNGSNIRTLDLRETIRQEGLDHYSLFFKTDHHWTPQAGFWASGKISEELARLSSKFTADPYFFDSANYHFQDYQQIWVGSHGRRTGILYGGLDDFCFITPEFPTNFTIQADSWKSNGIFEETILGGNSLSKYPLFSNELYNRDVHGLYFRGDRAYISVHNELNLQDERINPCKLLILKDSFALIAASFLATAYADVSLLDNRHFEGNVLELIEKTEPDVVIMVLNPTSANDSSQYNFFGEEE